MIPDMFLSLLMEKKHVTGEAKEIIERCGDIPVFTAEFSVLTQLTGFQLTRGVLCAMRRPKLPTVEEVCSGTRRIAVLENVMNPTNFPVCRRIKYGCHIAYIRLQQSSLPPCNTCQHGNCISNTLDLSGSDAL